MERMLQREIDAAARQVLMHLEPRREASLPALHETWTGGERSFYMGLGALILRRQVRLEERRGTIWLVHGTGEAAEWKDCAAALRTAASLHSCEERLKPAGEFSMCITCPGLLGACPSGGFTRLLLAA